MYKLQIHSRDMTSKRLDLKQPIPPLLVPPSHKYHQSHILYSHECDSVAEVIHLLPDVRASNTSAVTPQLIWDSHRHSFVSVFSKTGIHPAQNLSYYKLFSWTYTSSEALGSANIFILNETPLNLCLPITVENFHFKAFQGDRLSFSTFLLSWKCIKKRNDH